MGGLGVGRVGLGWGIGKGKGMRRVISWARSW